MLRFDIAASVQQPCVLFDVMDTLVADPFFRGFESTLFGMTGGIQELFQVKDQQSFVAFEQGQITEEEHFSTYFNDRRAVDGDRIRAYLRAHYEWLPGMKELCTELRDMGVLMGTFSNYPAEWAPLIEDAVNLSALVPGPSSRARLACESQLLKPSKLPLRLLVEARVRSYLLTTPLPMWRLRANTASLPSSLRMLKR